METKTITTSFIFNVTINCYLIRTSQGFILIDTGRTGKRKVIEKELEYAGCSGENLILIILTHGDFDHCGNAAYFRKKFGSPIAMHKDDSGMVECGDMLWNRRRYNILIRIFFKVFTRLKESDRFKPDFYLNEGYDFSSHGFDAKVVELPGHSKGSIGILTSNGDLFCGDLLANVRKPDVWSIIDEPDTAWTSIQKLKNLPIGMVYPGHGKAFPIEQFSIRHHAKDHLR